MDKKRSVHGHHDRIQIITMSDNIADNSSSQIPVCKCILSEEPSQEVHIPEYKQRMLSLVSRTEEYLRERRIPELIRFLLVKIIAASPSDPVNYLVNLIEQCMLYRSGYGKPPVLYEERCVKLIYCAYLFNRNTVFYSRLSLALQN